MQGSNLEYSKVRTAAPYHLGKKPGVLTSYCYFGEWSMLHLLKSHTIYDYKSKLLISHN